MAEEPTLKLHLEPNEPIEVRELTAALGSLARQYQNFAETEGFVARSSEARLLVSSVSHGSIDISLVPDFVAAGTLFAALVENHEIVLKFADRIKKLIELFLKGEKESSSELSIADCDDAVNIAKPIANHGGTQNFYVVNGDGNTVNVLAMGVSEARGVLESASREKVRLQRGQAEIKQRVPMIWKRLDREEAKTAGKSSPDKGLIEEVDDKPHAVLFTDDMSYLKREMIDDEENPYQKVYFVDVEVSRVSGKVASYRVIGYHGKDDLD